jgi:TolA-binding protein
MAILSGQLSLALHRNKAANPKLPPPGPGVLREVAVRDLPYGDALYYFYLGDYETALERLAYADSMGRLPHHQEDARLLMGGMELTQGDYEAAARLFAEVLDRPNVPDNVKDRAHFYLGKTWYRRGYYPQAIENLNKANSGTLPEDFDSERRLLLAEARIAAGEPAAAADVLKGWAGSSQWRAYAEYNLGVALLRSGQTETGVRALDELGQRAATGEEALALRDRANVALGYAYVQQHQGSDAIRVLSRVRADGAESARALLGAGWAAADAGNYREALAPWMELRGRDVADPAVQESYLAVPFGFARLGADEQAVEGYERALQEFSAETSRLDDAISSIRSGALRRAIEASNTEPGQPISIDMHGVTAGRYLYRLLAKDDIQAALGNWRDLTTVSQRLDSRKTDIDAFADLTAYRNHVFSERLPKSLEALERRDLESLISRRTELESKVTSASAHGDLADLGTPRQRAIWQRLEEMEAVIDRAGDAPDQDVDDIADRIEFLKGYLYFELSDGFKSRVWTARKRLRDVDRLLREATRSATLIKSARTYVPERNAEIQRQLTELQPRIEAIHARAEALRERELAAVANLAIGELETEKQRIRDYMLEARYSLATLYDRATADPATSKAGVQ